MSEPVLSKTELLGLVVRVAALSALSYYTAKWMMELLDPTRKAKMKAQEKARKLLRDLGINTADISLDEYEMTLASNLVKPDAIPTTWADIAGEMTQPILVLLQPLESHQRLRH